VNKPEPMTDEQIEAEDKVKRDAAAFGRAIIAARDAQWQAMLSAPHEAKTEAEKTAYAFGWWKALETAREKQ